MTGRARPAEGSSSSSSSPAILKSFDFQPLTRLVYGPGTLERLGQLAIETGVRRVLLVSDPGIVAAGHALRGRESLEAAGIEVAMFDGVGENPTTEHVDAGVAVARDHEVDGIVGLGGGSSMDCAKGVNFIYSCGGAMRDYWGVGKAPSPLLPMIAVPTTAGTGSETQSFALIADAETHQKMACGDKKAACRVAILDPLVTVSQPRAVTAATGIDAISHAVETFVTRPRNALSKALSLEAWALLDGSFERVLADPDDLEARAAMQLGAAVAGMAIEHSMLGAAHSAANPLTAHFDVVHGCAVGLMLPHVVRFNARDRERDYAELAARTMSRRSANAEGLAGRLEELFEASGLQADVPRDRESFGDLAAEAASQWTAQFNPRTVDEADFERLYELALRPRSLPTG